MFLVHVCHADMAYCCQDWHYSIAESSLGKRGKYGVDTVLFLECEPQHYSTFFLRVLQQPQHFDVVSMTLGASAHCQSCHESHPPCTQVEISHFGLGYSAAGEFCILKYMHYMLQSKTVLWQVTYTISTVFVLFAFSPFGHFCLRLPSVCCSHEQR